MALLHRSRRDEIVERAVASSERMIEKALSTLVREIKALIDDLQRDIDEKLQALTESGETRAADDEVAAVAAERVRSGAAQRTEDGEKALRELGISPR